MSTLVLVLAAGMTVPGDVPKEVSEEMEQGLDLRGQWEGIHRYDAKEPWDARLSEGVLTLEATRGKVSVRLVDEGNGRLRFDVAGTRYVGIYQQDSDRVVLCFRTASEGYPTSFRGGRGQRLLILHRVKSRK